MDKQIVPVDLGSRSYDIHIGADLFKHCADIIGKQLNGAKGLIIADEQVASHYADPLLEQLRSNGLDVALSTFPAGEPAKSLSNAEKLWQACAEHKIDRSSSLIALGGGVTGDLCGFVASCWMRGINFIQIPTSLLAMVDSSVGGKTGVNSAAGKNLIGAFKQPTAVIIDPCLVQSMDKREYRAGLAEVLKYGVIYDEAFLAWQENNAAALAEADADALIHAVAESCRIKAHYVINDEQEHGIRAHLNYGHTFGHALERLTNYKTYLHGEAVGIGMRMAAQLSQFIDLLTDSSLPQRQDELLSKFQLPLEHPCENIETVAKELTAFCSLDKKVSKGQTRFILVERCGSIHVQEAPSSDLIEQAFSTALVQA